MSVHPTDQLIEGIKHVKSGKVREVYEIPYQVKGEDALLFVASDRVSAFDVVLPNSIPDKGKVLNLISVFWFNFFRDVANHLIAWDFDEMVSLVPELAPYQDYLSGRAMLVKKTQPLAIECVVRGYLTGSGWKEYQQSGTVCGISLPENLKNSDKLQEVIFTPATKVDDGHDENIDETRARQIVGDAIFEEAKEKSIRLYKEAAAFALEKGIIICDTKFEFGLKGDALILIDEVLTPDSSRFWPKAEYVAGKSQPSFDKQIVRDYLDGLDWDKTPPGPYLPEDVVRNSRNRYFEVYELLTDQKMSV